MKLEEMKKYYEKGWNVIPITPMGDCKASVLENWNEYNSTRKNTLEELEGWAYIYEMYNTGIVTGKMSGITVLDIDVKNGGTNEFVKHIKTPTVKTGGGGWHYYFKYANIGDKINFLPGYDIKSNGYVVAPSSRHKSGNHYEWIEGPDTPLAEFPSFLLDLMKVSKYNPADKVNYSVEVSEGGRDVYATKILGGFIHLNKNDYAVAWQMALTWNSQYCRPPLEETQLRKIFESISKREMQKTSAVGDFPTFDDVSENIEYEHIPTGFKILDEKLNGGLVKSHSYLIASVEKAGKSSYLRKLTYQIASNGYKVAVIDTEQTDYDALKHFAVIESGKTISEVLPEDIKKVKDKISKNIVYMTRNNSESLLADGSGHLIVDKCIDALERAIKEKNIDVCIFDNVTPFATEGGNSTHQDRSKMMNALVVLAKRKNVAVVVVGHINSTSKDADLNRKSSELIEKGMQWDMIKATVVTVKRPLAKDVFGGSILTQFDCKLYIWRPWQSYKDSEQHKYSFLICDEQRHGAPFDIPMIYNGSKLDFSELGQEEVGNFFYNFGQVDK